MYLVSSVFLFYFTAYPPKDALLTPIHKKIFQICPKFDHKLVRPFTILVQAEW